MTTYPATADAPELFGLERWDVILGDADDLTDAENCAMVEAGWVFVGGEA